VLEVADGVFRVISTNGDTHLGGDDFDQCLINYVADEFKNQYGIDLRKDTHGAAAAPGSLRKGQEGA